MTIHGQSACSINEEGAGEDSLSRSTNPMQGLEQQDNIVPLRTRIRSFRQRSRADLGLRCGRPARSCAQHLACHRSKGSSQEVK